MYSCLLNISIIYGVLPVFFIEIKSISVQSGKNCLKITPFLDYSCTIIYVDYSLIKEKEMAEEKKNLFNQMVDALTNRDEKAAAEAAAKAKAEAEAKAAQEASVKAMAEKEAKARADMAAKAEADAKAAQEASMKAMAEKEAKARADMAAKAEAEAAAKKAAEEAAAKAAIIKHVWTSEDTYASLAQKFYGHFTEPYWRLIYNHNKDIIGNHPNAIRVGLEIEIPPLPDELKK